MTQEIKTVTDTSYLGFKFNPAAYDRLINVQREMDKIGKIKVIEGLVKACYNSG